MTPEDEDRKKIDYLLEEGGWGLHDYRDANLGAGVGVAVRYFPVKGGEADYMLFVERNAVGVVEAKPKAVTLGGVSEQTENYLRSFQTKNWTQLPLKLCEFSCPKQINEKQESIID